jgi:cobalt-zinc-cadmium efflux system outer membrane protein
VPGRLAPLGCVALTCLLGWPAVSRAAGQLPSSPVAAAGTIEAPAGALTYDAALQRARVANPRIAAARLRRSVALASRDVAAERLNPEFRVEAQKETPKESYGVAVPLELGGRRARRIEVADAAIQTGEAELALVVAEVEADVRRAYYARYVAERRRAVLDEMQGIARRARDAAQARFEAGDAARLDVVQAQLALADAENQAAAALGAVDAARATLNALLGFPLDAPTLIQAAFDVGPPLVVDALVARARQASTELAVTQRRIEEQRARVSLAHALRAPDLVPEAAVTRNAEPEFDTGWRAAVAVTLPILTTHRAGVRAEEATLAVLTSERDAAEARVAGEVASAAAIAESQRQQVVRYHDEIVPQAVDLERMAEDSYRLGQTGIAAYLQALQASRDVRLRAIQAAADLQNALADLERAIGAPAATLP